MNTWLTFNCHCRTHINYNYNDQIVFNHRNWISDIEPYCSFPLSWIQSQPTETHNVQFQKSTNTPTVRRGRQVGTRSIRDRPDGTRSVSTTAKLSKNVHKHMHVISEIAKLVFKTNLTSFYRRIGHGQPTATWGARYVLLAAATHHAISSSPHGTSSSFVSSNGNQSVIDANAITFQIIDQRCLSRKTHVTTE